jgi:hypothetical protein
MGNNIIYNRFLAGEAVSEETFVESKRRIEAGGLDADRSDIVDIIQLVEWRVKKSSNYQLRR